MERIIVFLDYANINRAANLGRAHLDFRKLLEYLSAGRMMIEAHAYVPIDPRLPHAMDRAIDDLWTDRYVVHSKIGTQREDTYKCNFDVEIAMDVMRAAVEIRPDTVVIGSGDGDFAPLVLALRNRGIRVEVFGFVDNTARDLILKASGFVDLDVYLSGPPDQREAEVDDVLEAAGFEVE